MTTFLITKKAGMTRIHREDGRVVGVTVLEVNPNTISGQRSLDKDGYEATIVKSNKTVAEVKSTDVSTTLEALSPLQAVMIQGITKGKGFSGTIKRYSFSRGPVSHGSKNIRQPGSAGAMYPQRIIKGQKMPGRLGGKQTTVKTFIEAVIPDQNIILVRGAVPGSRESVILLKTL